MKAVTYTKYGGPEILQLREVEKPSPADNELLVRVKATTVNRTDCANIRAKPFFMRLVTGLLRPTKQIPGSEFAGIVESCGKTISSLQPGDWVFGFDDEGAKCQAGYTTIRQDKVIKMPDSISFEQAAASSEGAHYALNFINKLNIQPGQSVLVNGSTGAIGSAAVQLLKSMQVNVTAVCATENVSLVKSLGADRVIDYVKEDFTMSGLKFNFVFDAVGKSSFFKCRHLLLSGGVYISSDLGYMAQNMFLPWITPLIRPLTGNRITIFPMPKNIDQSLQLIKSLIEKGEFKALIDRTYPLEQIIEAYTYVEKGHKKGNVVITLD